MIRGLPKGLTVKEVAENRYELKTRFRTIHSHRKAKILSGLIGLPLFLFCGVTGLQAFDMYDKAHEPFPAFISLTAWSVGGVILYSVISSILEATIRQTVRIEIDQTGINISGQFLPSSEACRPRVVPLWDEEQRRREGKSRIKTKLPMVEVIMDSGLGFARRTSVTEIIAPDAVELAQRLIGAMADLIEQVQRGTVRARTADNVGGSPSRPTTSLFTRETFLQEFAPGIRLYECDGGYNLRSKLPTLRSRWWAWAVSLIVSALVFFVVRFNVVDQVGGAKGWGALIAAVFLTYKSSRLFLEKITRPSVLLLFRDNGLWIGSEHLAPTEEWAARVVPDWKYEQRRSRGSAAMLPVVVVIIDAGPGLVRRINIAQICAADATDIGERYVAAIAYVVKQMQSRGPTMQAGATMASAEEQRAHDDW